MSTDFFDDFDKIREIIDEHGVMVQWVGAGDDEPSFAYTVGLAAILQPQLIIFGLGDTGHLTATNRMYAVPGRGRVMNADEASHREQGLASYASTQ